MVTDSKAPVEKHFSIQLEAIGYFLTGLVAINASFSIHETTNHWEYLTLVLGSFLVIIGFVNLIKPIAPASNAIVR